MVESKGVAMAILGIIVIIAVVGLVLLFKGATGKVSYSYEKPYTFIEQSAERLCSNMACRGGNGAIVLGEETHADGEYWVCGCPSNFVDVKIADWSNTWNGDPARNGNDFPNYEAIWRVRKIREY
jgi:hypothetical protein